MVRERENETDRNTQTDRRKKDSHIDRQTDRQSCRQTDWADWGELTLARGLIHAEIWKDRRTN